MDRRLSLRKGIYWLLVRAGVLLALAYLGPGSFASEELPRLQGEGFVETVLSEVEVGGVYVVGLMQGDALQSANGKEMFAWLPTGAGPGLCVTVKSIDGLYRATGRFVIEGLSAGQYVLAYGAKEHEALERYGPGDLILDGRVGSDCSRPEELIQVPLAWIRDAAPDRLAFIVNDDGHDSIIFIPFESDPNQVRQIACEALGSDLPNRVFSTVCAFENLEGLDMAHGWIEIRRYGQRIAWESFTVVIPAAVATP